MTFQADYPWAIPYPALSVPGMSPSRKCGAALALSCSFRAVASGLAHFLSRLLAVIPARALSPTVSMLSRVNAPCHQLKVVQGIVELVAVSVVNHKAVWYWAVSCFPYHPVLEKLSAILFEPTVSRLSNGADEGSRTDVRNAEPVLLSEHPVLCQLSEAETRARFASGCPVRLNRVALATELAGQSHVHIIAEKWAE